MKFLLLKLSLLLSIAIPGSLAWAQDFAVEDVQYTGAGCPQGSTSVIFSPDGSAFTLLFDRFQAQAGSGVPVDRKLCDIKVKIRKPKNMSFTVESADFRGFVALDEGVKGLQKAWIGSGVGSQFHMEASFAEQVWQGPLTSSFTLTSVRPETDIPSRTCRHPRERIQLHVRNILRITKARNEKSGMIAMDSVDGLLMHRYHMSWFNCP